MSSEKLKRVACEILLFPSLCFTVTQLHRNSFLHNFTGSDLRCVLDYLIECDLMDCIKQGIKTSRRSTAVYVKRLPYCDEVGVVDQEQKVIFEERLDEFKCIEVVLNLDEYTKMNSKIDLEGSGNIMNGVLQHFALQEYVMIDISPLHDLKDKGQFCNYLCVFLKTCSVAGVRSKKGHDGEICSIQSESLDRESLDESIRLAESNGPSMSAVSIWYLIIWFFPLIIRRR